MTCKDCKYHSYIGGTHFCDSRNHKRKTVRISEDDAQKDMNCKWADNRPMILEATEEKEEGKKWID